MSKSIEAIWKQGFVAKDALIAPKVNDLYDQKSKNVIDSLRRMFDLNLKGIVIGAVVVFAMFTAMSSPFLGAFIALLLVVSVMIGVKQLKKLPELHNYDSSFHYLKSFDQWLKQVIQEYTNIYKIIYPLIFIACAVRFGFSDIGISIIDGMSKDFTMIPTVFGMPIVLPLIVILIAFLLFFFTKQIYLADLKIVYGREFKKLQELISDMESLQNEDGNSQ